jgi:predicted transcriptional regulator
MRTTATRIRIPRHLKDRIDRLARKSGESSYAFMLRALKGQVEAAERYQEFLQDGVQADESMLRSGLGYAADDVHVYLEAKVACLRAHRPRPVRWRG